VDLSVFDRLVCPEPPSCSYPGREESAPPESCPALFYLRFRSAFGRASVPAAPATVYFDFATDLVLIPARAGLAFLFEILLPAIAFLSDLLRICADVISWWLVCWKSDSR
jgi:hypothetical protein